MNKLIFATQNPNKVEEVREALNHAIPIVSLPEAGVFIEIPEPFDTLQENAREKARVISQFTNEDCFGEDTGLEVDALDGEPGVKSARYAGEERDFRKNLQLLLKNMEGVEDRKARFRTVIALHWKSDFHFFEGVCQGEILLQPIGELGFGYDPIFKPEGGQKSFAQMTLSEKNIFSHRRKAMDQLVKFLRENSGSANA